MEVPLATAGGPLVNTQVKIKKFIVNPCVADVKISFKKLKTPRKTQKINNLLNTKRLYINAS